MRFLTDFYRTFSPLFFASHRVVYRSHYLTRALFVVCTMLAAANVSASINGPSTSSSEQVALTFTPPVTTQLIRFKRHYIRAYRNNTYVTQYNLAAANRSRTVTLTQDGTWRFDYHQLTELCTFIFQGECQEPEEFSRIDRHTVVVNATPGTSSTLNAPSVHTTRRLSVNWNAASGVVHEYQLEYKRTTSAAWSRVLTNSATRNTSFNVSEGTYQSRVRACNTLSTTQRCSAWRNAGNNVAVVRPSSVPALSLAANDADGSYKVSWNSSAHSANYTLQESLNGASWTTVQDTIGREKNYSGKANRSYYYRVRACNPVGCTSFSTTKRIDVARAPGVPASITAPSLHGSSSFRVSWGAASGDTSRYDLNEQPSTNIYDGTNLTHEVTGKAINRYRYQVRACKTVGSYTNCSAWKISNTVTLAKPSTPSITVPVLDTDGTYEVSWDAVSNTSNYTLEERQGTGAWATIHSGNATRFDVAGKDFNQYSYRVIACNDLGCSAPSSVGTIAVSPPIEDWAQSVAVEAADHTPGRFDVSTHDATVGALAGSGGASGGQSSYSIPVVIPLGRAGVQPSVGINYSSRGGNGTLGMGFALSASSSISRCGRTVVHDGINSGVQYDASTDRLCMGGQRLIVVSGSYGASGAQYRTELDSFSRITQNGNLNGASTWFKVERKNGIVAYYGESTDSRVRPLGAPATNSWLLKREQDRTTTANSIRYHYHDFGRGEVHISNIYYTGSGNTDGDRRVQFVYEARPDIASSYLSGGVSAQTRRLKTLVTYYQTTKVREYRFTYRVSPASERSLLATAQECGFNGTAAVCTPATQMSWYDDAPKFVMEKVGYRAANTANAHTEGGAVVAQLQDQGFIEKVVPHGDTNGDGTVDWPTWYANAEGVYQKANTNAERSCRRTSSFHYQCADADINRDGKTDQWRLQNNTIQVNYSAEQNSTTWINTGITVLANSGGVNNGVYSFGDYNADGWSDLVVSNGESFFDSTPRQLILYLHTGNPQAPYSSSAGITMFTYTEWATQPGQNASYSNNVQLMGDMNGDGLPDMTAYVSNFSKSAFYVSRIIYTRLTPQGQPVFNDNVAINSHRNSLPQSSDATANLRNFDYFMDVNGDGLSDWLAWENSQRLWLSLNQGNGSFAPWQDLGAQADLAARRIPINLGGEEVDTTTPKYGHALRQLDYDADGRSELLVPDVRLASSCLRRRTGRITTEFCGEQLYRPYSYSDPTNGTSSRTFDLATFDANVYQYKAFYFKEAANGTFTVESRSTSLIGSANQTLAMDAYGNGLTDVVFLHGCFSLDTCRITDKTGVMANVDPGAYVQRNRGSATGNARYEPMDMLQSVQTGLGVSERWHYRPLASQDPRYHSDDRPFYTPDFGYLDTLQAQSRDEHFHFSSSMYTVAEHARSNGIGGENINQWRYKGAVYNWKGRGFQGFRSVIAEDLTNGTLSQSDFHQIFPIAGQMEKQRLYALNDAANDNALDSLPAISETQYRWVFWPGNAKDGAQHYTIANASDAWSVENSSHYFVGLDRQTQIKRTLDVVNRRETFRTLQTSEFDVWGNATNTTTRYQEQGNAHIVESSSTTTYTVDENDWWLTRMSAQVSTRSPISSRVGLSIAANTDRSQSATVNYTNWNAFTRTPETVSTVPSSGKAITVNTVFNAHGLPTSVTTSSAGETNRSVTTTYTADGYFVRKVINALNHEVESQTDARYGTPVWVENANGQRSASEYDAFGRVTATTVDGITPPSFNSLQWCTSCGVANAQFKVITEQEGTPTQTAYVDNLGRTIRVDTQSLDNADNIVQANQYNARGLMSFESVPAFGTVSSLGTSYTTYDVLGRLTQKATHQTDGQTLSITYAHDQGTRGFTTDITADSLSMSRTYNGLGQLTQTVDALNGVTAYAYDGSGNPVVMQDANAQSITASYNALGQKLWVDDPNMGRKTFTYTGFGEVKTETDANNDTREYRYDILGRQTSRWVNGTQEASWVYDTATNGLGLLHQEQRTGQSFNKTYSYDSLSRPNALTTNIDGQAFTTRNQYDSYFGRPKGMQYPNGLTVAYGYNDRGYQTTVSNAATGYTYREVDTVDAYGQWQHAQMGMGTATVNRLYHAETGQVKELEIRNATGLLHAQNYGSYDVFGNLTQTSLNVPSIAPAQTTETYTYDNLHRLTYSTRTNGADIDYDYDAVGNLKLKNDYANTYHYTGAKPNAVTKVDLIGGGSTTFGYDGNGNRTHENGIETLAYNSYNKPTRITRNGTRLDFFYGADDMRYKQVNVTQNKTTLYVDKVFEQITEGATIKQRLFIDDIAVLTFEQTNGVRTDQNIGFTHRDRLGSAVAITDHLGILKEAQSFDPFGKPRLANTLDKPLAILDSQITTRGFTDHEHLDDVQLIHMNGRGYDYNLGRFLSVDPVIQSPGNSQSLNPYSYIMNNPLAGTDPSGYALVCGSTESASGSGPVTCENIGDTDDEEQSGSGEGDSGDDNGDVEVTGGRDQPGSDTMPSPSEIGDAKLRQTVVGAGNGPPPSNGSLQVQFNSVSSSQSGSTSLRGGGGSRVRGNRGQPINSFTDISNGTLDNIQNAFLDSNCGALCGVGYAISTALFEVMVTDVFNTFENARQGNVTGGTLSAVQAVVKPLKALGKLAESIRKGGRKNGALSQLEVKGQTFTGTSGQIELDPRLQQRLDKVPLEKRSEFHGKCSEISCINQALQSGINPKGGTMTTVNIKNGSPKEACPTCQHLMDQLRIKSE